MALKFKIQGPVNELCAMQFKMLEPHRFFDAGLNVDCEPCLIPDPNSNDPFTRECDQLPPIEGDDYSEYRPSPIDTEFVYLTMNMPARIIKDYQRFIWHGPLPAPPGMLKPTPNDWFDHPPREDKIYNLQYKPGMSSLATPHVWYGFVQPTASGDGGYNGNWGPVLKAWLKFYIDYAGCLGFDIRFEGSLQQTIYLSNRSYRPANNLPQPDFWTTFRHYPFSVVPDHVPIFQGEPSSSYDGHPPVAGVCYTHNETNPANMFRDLGQANINFWWDAP